MLARTGPAVAIVALAGAPAFAEGRQGPLLHCDFAGERITLHEDGGGYRLEVGGETFAAALSQPGPSGRVVAVFAMLDAGPVMVAVSTSDDGDPVHPSHITASRTGSAGLATRTTEGTCTEATR